MAFRHYIIENLECHPRIVQSHTQNNIIENMTSYIISKNDGGYAPLNVIWSVDDAGRLGGMCLEISGMPFRILYRGETPLRAQPNYKRTLHSIDIKWVP